MKSEYYYIRNKALANGLHWITGQRYIITESKNNPEDKVYCFIFTDKLMEALSKMNDLKKEFN